MHEIRLTRRDPSLDVEACRFIGIEQGFPAHFHDYCVIGLVESGRRRLALAHGYREIGPGDVVVIAPMQSHACVGEPDSPLDWRALHICGELAQLPDDFAVTRDGDAAAMMREIHEAIMKDQMDKEALEECTCRILGRIFGAQKSGIGARDKEMHSGRNRRTDKKLRAACDYLKNRYDGPVSLDELSAVCGVNKFSLLRRFSSHLGMTPHRYLTAVRVERAREMLAGGMPPSKAALDSGFADQSHFTRAFKSLTGLTPRLYQRAVRGA